MKHYFKKCDCCGKGMNEGYLFNEGMTFLKYEMAYACSIKCAKDYIKSINLDPEEEFANLEDKLEDGEDWFYWTSWDEDDYWTSWDEDEENYWEEMHFTEEGYAFNPNATKKDYLNFFQDIGADFWGWLLDGLEVHSPMNVYETMDFYQNSENSFELLLPEFLKYINKDPDGILDLQEKLEKSLSKSIDTVTNRERGLYAKAMRDADLREDAESFANWAYSQNWAYNSIRDALVDNIAPNGEMTTEQLDVLIFQFYKSWWKGYIRAK
jgi:hypothetical protein